MELLEIVNLQFALPIVGVLCLAILVFLFGFRAPIQPPVIAEDVVVALRKTKSKVSNKSKKVVANHLETTSEGTKLQASVSNKMAKKPTDKNDLNSTTVRVPAPLVQSKSKEVNVVDKDAELSKENDWMLATTKKLKKERVKHKQEHEIDDRKSASTVLKEAKSNVGAALKDSSVAVMEKSSKAVSQNNVSLEATAKQQKKVVEPEVNKPQPTQSKEAAQAVMTNTNGSVVIEKGEAAVASQLSTSSSKASEIIPAKAEKSDQSKKKGKKDKQPAAVVSQTVEQTKSSTAPDIKPVATAAKEPKKETTVAEERYHQVAVKAASELEQKTTASKKNKSKKAEKGADGTNSSVVEKETGESVATGQPLKDVNVQSSEQAPQSDLNSLEWEEIKAPKKKKKLRLD